jgi:hypothetical protein
VLATISFLIKVTPAPTAEIEYEPGLKIGLVFQSEEVGVDETEFGQHCPGTAAEPKAAEGFLCIYKSAQTPSSGSPFSSNAYEAAKESGVTFPIELIGLAGSQQYVRGTWAVTSK